MSHLDRALQVFDSDDCHDAAAATAAVRTLQAIVEVRCCCC